MRIIKQLVTQEARQFELESAMSKAVKLGRSGDLKNIQSAHKLFEAAGPAMLTSNSNLSYEYGCCKYYIYRLNKQETQQGAISGLFSYLKEADEYIKKAVQLTSKECRTSGIADQYCMLGQVHFELHLLEKSTAAIVDEYYEKAREMKPDIKINQFLVPSERWKTRSKRSSKGKHK